MSPDTPHPAGLVTDAEQATLTDAETASEERARVCERVRDRLVAVLRDCQLLYPALRDADFEAVFSPTDTDVKRERRAMIQDAMGILVLGMFCNDDHVDRRVTDAIRYAGFAYGEEVDVSLTVRRSPMPTPEQWLARPSVDDLGTGLALFEHFLWDEEVAPAQVASVGRRLGLDEPAEAVREANGAVPWCQRPPQTAVLSVEAGRHDPDTESGGNGPPVDQ